jgi:hypothetical protein
MFSGSLDLTGSALFAKPIESPNCLHLWVRHFPIENTFVGKFFELRPPQIPVHSLAFETPAAQAPGPSAAFENRRDGRGNCRFGVVWRMATFRVGIFEIRF